MLSVTIPGLSLGYRCFGQQSAPCIVLLHGAAMQLTDWPPGLIEQLSRHLYVVVFDLRDAGLSTKFGPCLEQPTAGEGQLGPEGLEPSYSLFDMADDVAQAIAALRLGSVHLLGFSMGGMVAQILAARRGDQVRSLISLMSSGGQAGLHPTEAVRLALAEACTTRATPELAAERLSLAHRAYYSAGHGYDQAALYQQMLRSLRRSYCPLGVSRQLRAIDTTEDRRNLLIRIACPTLIIHGAEDPCIDVCLAREASGLIPDCSFEALARMGHEFTADHIAEVTALTLRHCLGIERRRSSRPSAWQGEGAAMEQSPKGSDRESSHRP